MLRATVLCLACAATCAARAEEPAAPTPTRWEGALGLNSSWGPTYPGSERRKLGLSPGFFLRYGRVTLTNSSGYVTRRADDVFRGLGVDLSSSERLRVNLALRYDGGRAESTDPALNGLGDIRRTVRGRLSATWRGDDGWRLGASWSLDLLGRGGGGFGDLSVAREHRSSPDTTWTAGAGLSLADGRWMQSNFGVDATQAAATGYPVYAAHAGLRDVTAFTNLRHELSPRWLLLGGATLTRLVGPAAGSPMTRRPLSLGLNGALAWRF